MTANTKGNVEISAWKYKKYTIQIYGGREMITRNWQGKIEPKIGCYVVRKERNCWKIIKQEPYYNTNAVLAGDPWWILNQFDSMVKAYAWLKKHVDELL